MRFFLLSFLFLAVALLAYSIEGQSETAQAGFTLTDSLTRFLGSTKEAVGDTLFLKADQYFHGGVCRRKDIEESAELMRREGIIEEEAEHEDAEPQDWIARINAQIKSAEHLHLTSEQRKETLPFFKLATTLDPHHVEAILTSAYWLMTDYHQVDEAIDLLKKGTEDNPDSWEIPFRLANLYFKEKKDYATSERYYAEAFEKARGQDVERYYRVDMHYFLAESLVAQGRQAKALPHYRQAVGLYGGERPVLRQEIEAKIRDLEAKNPL